MLWQFAKDLLNVHGFWMDSVAMTPELLESLAATGVPIGAVELIWIWSWSEFDHFLGKKIYNNNYAKKFTNGIQPQSSSDFESKDEEVSQRPFQGGKEAWKDQEIQKTEGED